MVSPESGTAQTIPCRTDEPHLSGSAPEQPSPAASSSNGRVRTPSPKPPKDRELPARCTGRRRFAGAGDKLLTKEEEPMAVRFQLVIDCTDPELLAHFWAAALGYELEPPPAGFATWDDYWRDVGVPEADLGIGEDCIIDPAGGGPRIWFQVVPESKTIKNRLHLDVHVSGGRAVPIETRRQRVDAEARRLSDLGGTIVGALTEEGIDHYGVAMKDPEGNEFDIN
jgi:hypothetical protein